MFWLNFPFLRPLCLLASGIWLSDLYAPAWPAVYLYALLGGAYFVFILFSRLLPLLFPFLWLILGFGIYAVHQGEGMRPLPQAGHLTIEKQEYTSSARWDRYQAVILARYRNNQWYHDRVRIHLYLPESESLRPGDQLVFRGQIRLPDPPLHVFMFDYRRYLALEGIQGQLFLSENFRKTGKQVRFRHRIIHMQEWVRNRINQWIANPDQSRLLTGMVLGEKRGLREEIRQAYAVTGSMHVLAVSGLHVGLIYFLIASLLSVFPQKHPWPLIRYVLVLIVLLTYAALAGFTPSVVRAVVFILLFLLCRLLRRPNPLPHVLYLTAFLMLVADPLQLFRVSFQLSFLAVLGIMLLMPWLEPVFSHRRKVPDYLLKNISLSISVQASTFMLSVHYFHQLSFSFWIAATLVVPATFVVLVLALMLFLVHPVTFLREGLATLISFVLENVTLALQWLAQLPYGHISQVYWPVGLTAGLAVILYFLVWTVVRKKKSLMYFSCTCLLVWALALVYTGWQTDAQHRLAVYATAKKQWYVLRIQGRRGTVWSPDCMLQEALPEAIGTWFAGHGTNVVVRRSLPEIADDSLLLKIDGVTMVFWVKSDNFPFSGSCINVRYGKQNDTLCTGRGQVIFHQIPQVNEPDRSI